jgi:iron complex transport system substrate-binding protein
MNACNRAAAILLCAISSLWATAVAAQARTFTDDAGRVVRLPPKVERVYAAGPPASVLVLALAPEKLLGWTRAFRPAERAFVPQRYAELPELGRLTGRGNTANPEVVLKAKADLIVDIGATDPTFVSLADRVQSETGIPYILLDGRLAGLPAQIDKLGQILGAEARARELAAYATRTLDEIKTRIAKIPADRRPEVLYARGPQGLTTGLGGSINVEMLEWIGAKNVAASQKGGLAQIGFEQVVLWNPDVIITNDPHFYRDVWAKPEWAVIKAVKSKRVFLSPNLPFGWFDYPPGANRLIGLKWLANLLYPGEFKYDLAQEMDTFYTLFYLQKPTAEQVAQVLGEPGVLPR